MRKQTGWQNSPKSENKTRNFTNDQEKRNRCVVWWKELWLHYL